MTVKAQDIFITAMNLMDQTSQDGTFTGYPDEYKKKSWSILSLLQAELVPVTTTPVMITGETDVFIVDDRTVMTALPYGLAAHLLLTEDPTRASFFNSRYDELKRLQPLDFVEITGVYTIDGDGTPTTTEDTHIIVDGGKV